MPLRELLSWSFVIACTLTAHAQRPISDSTYLNMADRTKAIEAIRFDLAAYDDTLRVYRESIEFRLSSLGASTHSGEEQRARLGRMRRDIQQLDKEMAVLGKRVKKSSVPFETAARDCANAIRRTNTLRTELLSEGVQIQQ